MIVFGARPMHPMLSFRGRREVVDKQGAWFRRVSCLWSSSAVYRPRMRSSTEGWEICALGSEAPLMWRCILWVHLNAPISYALVDDGITGRVLMCIQLHPSVSLHDTKEGQDVNNREIWCATPLKPLTALDGVLLTQDVICLHLQRTLLGVDCYNVRHITRTSLPHVDSWKKKKKIYIYLYKHSEVSNTFYRGQHYTIEHIINI